MMRGYHEMTTSLYKVPNLSLHLVGEPGGDVDDVAMRVQSRVWRAFGRVHYGIIRDLPFCVSNPIPCEPPPRCPPTPAS